MNFPVARTSFGSTMPIPLQGIGDTRKECHMRLGSLTILLGACGGCLLAGTQAKAEMSCVSLSATVTGIRPNASALLSVPSLEVGTDVTVSFAYDPATQAVPQDGSVSFHVADLGLHLVIDGVASGPTDQPSGDLLLIDSADGLGSDSLSLLGRVEFSGLIMLVHVLFIDESGTAFDTPVLPSSLDLARFTRAILETRSPPGDGKSFLFEAGIESIVPCSPEASFIRGEVDGNGSLTLSDAVRTFLYLFAAGEPPSCLDAADSNDDGTLDLSDGIRTLLYLFGGGDPLPAPSDCATDPTPDALSCKAFAGCGAKQ
jgi:hypothetical protein